MWPSEEHTPGSLPTSSVQPASPPACRTLPTHVLDIPRASVSMARAKWPLSSTSAQGRSTWGPELIHPDIFTHMHGSDGCCVAMMAGGVGLNGGHSRCPSASRTGYMLGGRDSKVAPQNLSHARCMHKLLPRIASVTHALCSGTHATVRYVSTCLTCVYTVVPSEYR